MKSEQPVQSVSPLEKQLVKFDL